VARRDRARLREVGPVDQEEEQEEQREDDDREPGQDQADQRPPTPTSEFATTPYGEDDREHRADGTDHDDAQPEEERERSIRVLRRHERCIGHLLSLGCKSAAATAVANVAYA